MPRESLTIGEAKALIYGQVRPGPAESVPLINAIGRHLFDDVTAPYSLPLWDGSAMDGYAVRAADLANASADTPASLPVAGEIPAGRKLSRPMAAGSCVRIFTGARMPDGADAVVRQEDCVQDGPVCRFTQPVAQGLDVRTAGEDVVQGRLIAGRGDLVTPALAGLLASLRLARVPVFAKPRMLIFATGDELAGVRSRHGSTAIVNSNSYTIHGLATQAGAAPVMGGIVRDNRASVIRNFPRTEGFDIVVTTGGVSVGKYDLVREVFGELGVRWIFWKIRIRPGQPVAFGIRGRTLFFGLPGNPVSAMVTFDQFVRPAILRMCGVENPERPVVFAELAEPVDKKPGRTHILRGRVEVRDGRLVVHPAANQSSAALSVMAAANCLVFIDEHRTRLDAGEQVPVELIHPF